MKKITLFLLLSFITPFVFSQTIVNPVFDGIFDGTTYSQTYNFPTGAQPWAGFANNNTSIYPLSYPNGGQVSFKATVATNAEIKFVFEADLYPAVNPSVSTVNVPLLASNPANTVYTVAIPANATNTYRSALMYVVTRDVAVSLSEIKLIKYDTNGTSQLRVDFPVYEGTFDGTTYSQTFNFPTGAQPWAGFSNNNVAIYPLSFPSGTNKVTFKATVPTNAEIKFVFEANPYPAVNPSVSTANVALLASNPANTLYEVDIPVNATNTYRSAIMYIITRDVPVSLSEIKIQMNNTPTCSDGIQNGSETGVDCGGTCAPCATFSAVPTTNAPTPIHLQANVVSVFSDSYTTIATNLNPNWGQTGTVNPAFTVTAGNNILAYTNFNYQGTLLTSTNLSDMEYLHVDVYSSANPGATVLKVTPVSNGAAPPEVLVTINHVQGQWYSVDIPKSAFTGMTWASIHQMKFAANVGTSAVPANFYFDNIYFWKTAPDPAIDAKLSDLKVAGATISGFASGVESYTYEVLTGTTAIPQITSVTTSNSSATTVITQATAIPGSATVVVTSSNGTVTKTYTVNYLYYGPSTAAPTPPARLATDVVSIYSDAYTPIIFDNFDAGWCGGVASTEIQVAGNNTLQKNPGVICHGIEFPSNRLDLTAFTHIHFDFYITDTNLTGDVFNVKLVDFAGGSAQVSALEVSINGGSTPQLVGNQWVSVDVPITALGGVVTNNLTRSNVAQFAITTAMVDRVLYDNIYFHKNTVLSSDSFTTSKVKLYPNPTSNVLNIESLGTIQTISVYNVLGQEVINKALNSTSTSLDVSSLNSGIYVVKTVVDGVTSSTKFIKQ